MSEAIRLVWPGRSWKVGEGADPHVAGCLPPPAVHEHERVGDSTHRLVHGDVLDLTHALGAEKGKVDLVYVDPPYASERDYVAEARLDGPASPHGRVTRTFAYDDRWSSKSSDVGAYLDMMAPRLEALASLLAPTGTIWVHVDWRASYLVRALLDEICGRDAFVNEVVWRRAPNLGRQAASGQFGRTLDTIVVYGRRRESTRDPKPVLRVPTRLETIEPGAIRWEGKPGVGRPFTLAPRGDYTDLSIAKLEKEGRVHRTATGRVYIKYHLVKDESGTWCRERRVDALWTDVAPLRHVAVSERTGYPTQKPRALLERIALCASPPGGLVVDAFAGSGTTGVAAHACGRRAVLGDRSPVAIATARARLLREGAGLVVERAASMAAPPPGGEVQLEADEKRIRLVRPTEPLAWAIGTMKGDVFRTAWHSERAPGTKPVPAKTEALRSGLPSGELAVRVWGDDGSVTDAVVTQRTKKSRATAGAQA